RSPRRTALLAVLGGMSVVLLPGLAFGAGLIFPDMGARVLGRAGAFVAKGDDITALGINPAQLAKLRGWNLHVSLNIPMNPIELTCKGLPNCTTLAGQPVSGVKNSKFGIGNFNPILGVSTNFGLKTWSFGFVFMAPPGVGNKSYPVDGPQRYDTQDIDFRVF